MDALALARWQFAITTVYHFIFVPLTIGLAPLVAIMQTAWVRTGNDHWLKLTKFFGKLFLINFALGVVTGIVQEFQFGMNWSEYSRFVGDIFGAPLAMEALAAFFIESTFIGLWIFGWGRLKRGVHLTCIWLVAIGVNLSAFFILAANSFMQHPVGAKINPETGRAEMTDIGAVLFSNLSLATIWHTISTAFLVAGTFVCAIAAFKIVKHVRKNQEEKARTYRPAAILGAWVTLIAAVSVVFSGHNEAVIITDIQPTKMAAAEALCVTPPEGEGAPFTLAAFGDCSDGDGSVVKVGEIPGLLSFVATFDSKAKIAGLDEATAEFQAKYPPRSGEKLEAADYAPPVMLTFWSFRLMMGFGLLSAALAIGALIILRKGKVSGSGLLKVIAGICLPLPFLGAAFGWIFTEIGRQPWIVYPGQTEGLHLLTQDAVSPDSVVGSGAVWATMIGFTLLYAVLAVFWAILMRRYVRHGVVEDEPKPDEIDDNDDSRPLSFAY